MEFITREFYPNELRVLKTLKTQTEKSGSKFNNRKYERPFRQTATDLHTSCTNNNRFHFDIYLFAWI